MNPQTDSPRLDIGYTWLATSTQGTGAKQDGIIRNHLVGADGALRDTVIFSILASEWPAVRVGLEYSLASRGRSSQ